jgi:hypothetical protein
MTTTEEISLVGPCGINCSECECFKAKDDPALMEYMVSKGIKNLPCLGCRPIEGKCPVIGCTCETYSCATQHNIDFCFECSEFPCDRLNPAADRANVLPHNLKVFNLCCIKQQGLTKFLEKSTDIRKKYYSGKMVIGNGPQIE